MNFAAGNRSVKWSLLNQSLNERNMIQVIQHKFLFCICLLVASASIAATPIISADELQNKLDGDNPPTVLDVRSSAEYAAGHVPGAINVPLQSLATQIQKLDNSKKNDIVVYCERGVRAARAETILISMGYQNLFHLDGDMAAWRKSNRPTEIPR